MHTKRRVVVSQEVMYRTISGLAAVTSCSLVTTKLRTLYTVLHNVFKNWTPPHEVKKRDYLEPVHNLSLRDGKSD